LIDYVLCSAVQFVLLFSCIEGVHLQYEGYQFPAWAEGIGWLIAAIVISMIPLWAGLTVFRSIGSCQALCWLIRSPASVIALNLRDVVSPSDDWGPALECNRGRPHQSPRSYHWVYIVLRVLRLKPRWTRQTSDSSSTVADHEGHCFVTETSFYQQPSIDEPISRY